MEPDQVRNVLVQLLDQLGLGVDVAPEDGGELDRLVIVTNAVGELLHGRVVEAIVHEIPLEYERIEVMTIAKLQPLENGFSLGSSEGDAGPDASCLLPPTPVPGFFFPRT